MTVTQERATGIPAEPKTLRRGSLIAEFAWSSMYLAHIAQRVDFRRYQAETTPDAQ